MVRPRPVPDRVRSSPRAHYVRHNATTRVPRSHVYLDTEAYRTKVGRTERQTFRLAVAAHDARSHKGDGWRDRRWYQATDTAGLWLWISGCCRSKARTVLVCHNLAYDMRISNAFAELPACGWQFVNGRVDDRQVWFLWKRGSQTLCCVDSVSWCPVSLEHLGDLCGIPKLALPDDADDQATWFARCERDVEILADVWRRLMGWVEDEDLGNWRFSGAGQSWSAFRHRFYTHKLFVHADDDARVAERAAAHTGRCEAWRHGQLRGGPFTEWDFTTAYAQIGRECDVPTTLVGEVPKPTLEKVFSFAQSRAVLVECEVTTDVPTLPCRTESGICWPVGTFRTTCWDSELELVASRGADVVVERAWVYRRAPALRDFCTWVLSGLDGSRGIVDPVVRVALKHWSRAIVGRMAAQWSRWDRYGTASVADVAVFRAYDADDDESWRAMQLGHQLFRQRGRPENPDASVAVMSWIMAESRVRLWRAMETAGFGNVVYCDTDSLIVTPAGDRALESAAIPGLRVKGEWRSLKVLGPRQLVPGAQLRAAGVPRGAVQVGPAQWEADVWSGLSRSLSAGAPSSVEVARRRFTLLGTDNRRLHLKGGLTVPRSLSISAVAASG